MLEERLYRFYELLGGNSGLTEEYVKEALESVKDTLDEINSKVNTLLPKSKKKHEIQPLRNLMDRDLFPMFI